MYSSICYDTIGSIRRAKWWKYLKLEPIKPTAFTIDLDRLFRIEDMLETNILGVNDIAIKAGCTKHTVYKVKQGYYENFKNCIKKHFPECFE